MDEPPLFDNEKEKLYWCYRRLRKEIMRGIPKKKRSRMHWALIELHVMAQKCIDA